MAPSFQLRSFVTGIVPPPVARLVRRALLWKRWAQFEPYVLTRSMRGESIPVYIGDATAKQWYGSRVWVLLHGSADVTRWNGEDLTSAPPPKFHLFMLPA